jgi:hypothetical protein
MVQIIQLEDHMSSIKYTNRSNARRAGMTTGLSADRIEITVHKFNECVKFGWREKKSGSEILNDHIKSKTTIEMDAKQHGIKRPKAGGLCAAVWQHLDANPKTTAKELRAIAISKTWNMNNALCELYAWRKYHGITKASGDKKNAANVES